MFKIHINSLPIILYAHTYSSKTYQAQLYLPENQIELTYLEKGTLTLINGNKSVSVNEDCLIAYVHDTYRIIRSDCFQKHLTIGLSLHYDTENLDPTIMLPSEESIAMAANKVPVSQN